MLYRQQFDNVQVWIKNSGEVEIKSLEMKRVLMTLHISDYRIRDAQEALMDDGFTSVDEVIAKVEAANAIDALHECCKRYWLLGISGKHNSVSLRMGNNNLLFFWKRNGLNSGFCGAMVSNEVEGKHDTYNFDFYNSAVLIEILQAVASYSDTEADRVKILDILKKHNTKIASYTTEEFLDEFKKALKSTRV